MVIMIAYVIVQSKSKRATKPEIPIEYILTPSTTTFSPLDLVQYRYDETGMIPADDPEGWHIIFRARIPRTDSSSCRAVRWGWEVYISNGRDKHYECVLDLRNAMRYGRITMK